ncbi:MAG: lysoplasmalogenase [Paracoccaceae bacterium]
MELFDHLIFRVGFCLAVLYGLWGVARPPGWGRSILKTGSVLCLALVGWLLQAPGLLVLGCALGAVGDFCLSRPARHWFLAGMAAFAIGHLAYGLHFLLLGGALPGLLPALMVLALALSTELWLAPHTGALRWPVRAYVLVIGLMALAALGLPADHRLALVGAALFLLSDILLAIDLFRLPDPGGRPDSRRRLLQGGLWGCYWVGQALILAGG